MIHFVTKFPKQVPYFIIIFLGFLILGNGIFNGFVSDDIPQITDNAIVHDVTKIPQIFTTNFFYNDGQPLLGPAYYKPIMYTSFSLLYFFFRTNPYPYHIFQILLCITNACLLFFFFTHFLRKPTALFLSLLFLLHPINSEIAMYLSTLQDNLYFFFGIVASIVLLRKNSLQAYAGTAVLLLLSLLSKETGILFLGITNVFILFYRRKQWLYYTLLEILIFSSYIFFRLSAIGFSTPFTKSAPIEILTLAERLLTIPLVFLFYIKMFFLPQDFSTSWMWVNTKLDLLHVYLPLIVDISFFTLVLYGAFFLYKKANITKKKTDKKLFWSYCFFTTWFFMGIVFHSQLIPFDKTVAERWFYFPCVGILGIVGIMLDVYKLHWETKTILFCASILLLFLSSKTLIRSFDFRSDLTLASHDAKVAPDSYDLETELCFSYFQLHRYDLVKLHAIKSIKLFPFVVNYTDLGVAYFYMHDYKQAKKAYMEALKYGEYDATYVDLSALALVYGNPKENIVFLRNTALKKFPHNSALWKNVAILEYLYGDKLQAKTAIQKAYALKKAQGNEYEYYYVYNNISNNLTLQSYPRLSDQ